MLRPTGYGLPEDVPALSTTSVAEDRATSRAYHRAFDRRPPAVHILEWCIGTGDA
jgi:hypothetical protein